MLSLCDWDFDTPARVALILSRVQAECDRPNLASRLFSSHGLISTLPTA